MIEKSDMDSRGNIEDFMEDDMKKSEAGRFAVMFFLLKLLLEIYTVKILSLKGEIKAVEYVAVNFDMANNFLS